MTVYSTVSDTSTLSLSRGRLQSEFRLCRALFSNIRARLERFEKGLSRTFQVPSSAAAALGRRVLRAARARTAVVWLRSARARGVAAVWLRDGRARAPETTDSTALRRGPHAPPRPAAREQRQSARAKKQDNFFQTLSQHGARARARLFPKLSLSRFSESALSALRRWTELCEPALWRGFAS